MHTTIQTYAENIHCSWSCRQVSQSRHSRILDLSCMGLWNFPREIARLKYLHSIRIPNQNYYAIHNFPQTKSQQLKKTMQTKPGTLVHEIRKSCTRILDLSCMGLWNFPREIARLK